MNIRSTLPFLALLAVACSTPPPAEEVDPFSLGTEIESEPAPEAAAPEPAKVVPVVEPAPIPLVGLRTLAARKGLDWGAAVSFKLLSIAKYDRLVGSEFSSLTPENEMKWEIIHPTSSHYEWFFGDQLVAYAQAHQMKVRGHTLVWHSQLPRWVGETVTTRDQVLKLVNDHVTTIVGHYAGQIGKWDVVNEVIDDKEGFRSSVFSQLTGTDFIDTAFRAAHEADPKALLYINDYSVEGVNAKSDRLYALVKQLIARGVPIHGVGLQSHLDLDDLPTMASMRQNITRFQQLGLRVDLTELDIRFRGPATEERLAQQARAYADIVGVVLTTDGTDSVTIWGVDDAHSWIPGWNPAFGNALIFDRRYQPKPAYTALVGVISQ